MSTALLLLIAITIFSLEMGKVLREEYIVVYFMLLVTFTLTFSTLYLVFFMRFLKEKRMLYEKEKKKVK